MNINSKFLVRYINHDAIRQLVLMLPKTSEYVRTFKNKDKKMSFHIDDKFSENYRTTWTKIENLKNIGLNTSSVYSYRYRN